MVGTPEVGELAANLCPPNFLLPRYPTVTNKQ
jgi:hypothetical protein